MVFLALVVFIFAPVAAADYRAGVRPFDRLRL